MNPQIVISPSEEAELRQALESSGWRYTHQRAAVFHYLRAIDTHPTAEQVFAGVRQLLPNISLATVYKALEALVDVGLGARVPDPKGPMRYDGRSEAHYHIRCERTGRVQDLPIPYDASMVERLAPDLIEQLRRQGFKVTGHRIEILGQYVESVRSQSES